MLLTCLGVYLSVWTQKKSWEAQRDSMCVRVCAHAHSRTVEGFRRKKMCSSIAGSRSSEKIIGL